MTDRTEIVDRLEQAGVLNGIRWAYASAVSRTLDDYSEAAGHDAAWLGNTRFILLRDRLDRIFSCSHYVLRPGMDTTVGLDLLRAELSETDIATMPMIPPDLARRANLNQSPGWAIGETRFLIASSAFGKVDSLPWTQHSPTKQLVASQPTPEPLPTLFDDTPGEEWSWLASIESSTLDLDTLVVAHSLDAVGQRVELVIGRPHLNHGGGDAWHWSENLLTGHLPNGGNRLATPSVLGPDVVPDAPVRLRAANESTAQRSGNE